MLLSGAPTKTTVPFANSGAKNTIPVAASVTPGLASYTTGFPALTMTPLSAGGIPPAGQDFNGILNAISQAVQYYSAGATFAYDSAFSSAVTGYPKGALLQSATVGGLWLSTVDANSTNPDMGGTGWASITSGRLINTQYFKTAGTFVYTPTVGTNFVEVELCGGGGGGGGSQTVAGGQASVAGSGQGAGYARKKITSGFSGVTVTVAVGGAAGAAGANNGGNGGSSSFGALVTTTGGAGGSAGAVVASFPSFTGGGAPGAASGGDINSPGGPAGVSFAFTAAGALSGIGGGSPFGGGAPSANSSSGGGSSAGAFGAGASGAASDATVAGAKSGGLGGQGIVIVREYS